MMISTKCSDFQELKKLISHVMTHNSDIAGKSGVDCNYGSGQRDSWEITKMVISTGVTAFLSLCSLSRSFSSFSCEKSNELARKRITGE